MPGIHQARDNQLSHRSKTDETDIHVDSPGVITRLAYATVKTWMASTRPAMTEESRQTQGDNA
jgi:hypothetical protein